jgi:hypothetical protein
VEVEVEADDPYEDSEKQKIGIEFSENGTEGQKKTGEQNFFEEQVERLKNCSTGRHLPSRFLSWTDCPGSLFKKVSLKDSFPNTNEFLLASPVTFLQKIKYYPKPCYLVFLTTCFQCTPAYSSSLPPVSSEPVHTSNEHRHEERSPLTKQTCQLSNV